jgi:hypothetical protein
MELLLLALTLRPFCRRADREAAILDDGVRGP